MILKKLFVHKKHENHEQNLDLFRAFRGQFCFLEWRLNHAI